MTKELTQDEFNKYSNKSKYLLYKTVLTYAELMESILDDTVRALKNETSRNYIRNKNI